MAQGNIKLEFSSRMKHTPVYARGGKTFFGLWRPPEIKLDGDEKQYQVNSSESGQLDLIAHREYQDRKLFWAIALVNKIMDINGELPAGTILTIPKISNIQSALSAMESKDA